MPETLEKQVIDEESDYENRDTNLPNYIPLRNN